MGEIPRAARPGGDRRGVRPDPGGRAGDPDGSRWPRAKRHDDAAFLGLERSSVSGLIDRAVRRGLVRRTANSDDGRSVQVSLTAEGQQLAPGRPAKSPCSPPR
ncbi:MAG TPA: MarR family transcriptional regulator [Streptosporangiaceae bacterium]|nr:MarR family transcriptional regulator [Streptosporangiaceae bacterium]